MPVARSEGLRINYEVWGAGRPVVLAHGWGADIRRNWADAGWVDALATDRRVIALDIRGHGQSDKPHDQRWYGYASMAHDVLAVLDDLGLPAADFVGYSLGAFSGMHLLGHHADRLTAAVLIGIGDETPDSIAAADDIAASLRADDPADIEHPLGRAYRSFVDADATSDREALAAAALEMWPQGFPLRIGGEGLGKVSNPVLVLNGADDRPYVESDEALVAAIPTAALLRVDGCDHLAGVWDPRFKDAVAAFLPRDEA